MIEKMMDAAKFCGINITKEKAESILDKYEPLLIAMWNRNDYIIVLLNNI